MEKITVKASPEVHNLRPISHDKGASVWSPVPPSGCLGFGFSMGPSHLEHTHLNFLLTQLRLKVLLSGDPGQFFPKEQNLLP